MIGASAASAELGKAPAAPAWADNLPPATQTDDGTTILPPELASAVFQRLLFLDLYPALCQQSIDEYAAVVAEQWRATLELEQAKAQAAQLAQDATRWQWYHVAGGIAGALIVGLGAGYVAGHF